jgi:heme/copper-type cytochrome/quinol oxidase subunit 3
VIDVSHLPASSVDTHGMLWWGNALMLVIEGMVLALLVAVYFYLRFWLPVWPPPGAGLPPLGAATLNLLVLALSTVPMHRADKAAEKGDRHGVQVGLIVGMLFGLVFLAGQILIWRSFSFDYASHAYGSIVFTLLGLHCTHVAVCLVEVAVLLVLSFLPDDFHDEQRLGVVTSGLYWNFVAGTWVVLYLVLFFGPRVL